MPYPHYCSSVYQYIIVTVQLYADIVLLKYTATHEQVTRSAPSREPNDHRDLTLRP